MSPGNPATPGTNSGSRWLKMDADGFPRLIQGLLRPTAYPHPVGEPSGFSDGPGLGPVDHIETHISHVLLAGDYAYKLKKPLDLGFLDFSTLERRQACCEEELRLNRRLAGDLYLAVVPITGTPDSPRIGGLGPVLEYAVLMRRFPQRALLDRAPLTPTLAQRIGERVASFHAALPKSAADSPFGAPDAVLGPMLENLRHVRGQAGTLGNAERLDRLDAWTRARWKSLIPVLEARREEGRVRECHGDMHRANIALVQGEPLFFDAIEFNPYLRWIDTASELAFLVMDLEAAGEPRLARRLLNRYLETGGDYGALLVLDFYKVYRAMVRAKVLAIRLGQPGLLGSPGDPGTRERQDCDRYLALAESYTRTRRPRLLIACGFSGSGKSRLARALREVLPAIHLRSDLERKRLFGMREDERSGTGVESGIYFPQATEWTYQRLHALTGTILDCGYDALVDATFLARSRRASFHVLARRHEAGFAILEVHAPIEVLRRRVLRRLAAGDDASEAGIAVLEGQRAACEPLTPAERESVLSIDTTHTPPMMEILERIAMLTGVPVGS
jgi:uncharacterized protein